mmetsp:Transcript_9737/g.39574  ORF Transcript_9737/g.39574 Transcript_9737/m.39574 type:complete len:792 (-) Transcript_9737:2135-4510(-)
MRYVRCSLWLLLALVAFVALGQIWLERQLQPEYTISQARARQQEPLRIRSSSRNPWEPLEEEQLTTLGRVSLGSSSAIVRHSGTAADAQDMESTMQQLSFKETTQHDPEIELLSTVEDEMDHNQTERTGLDLDERQFRVFFSSRKEKVLAMRQKALVTTQTAEDVDWLPVTSFAFVAAPQWASARKTISFTAAFLIYFIEGDGTVVRVSYALGIDAVWVSCYWCTVTLQWATDDQLVSIRALHVDVDNDAQQMTALVTIVTASCSIPRVLPFTSTDGLDFTFTGDVLPPCTTMPHSLVPFTVGTGGYAVGAVGDRLAVLRMRSGSLTVESQGTLLPANMRTVSVVTEGPFAYAVYTEMESHPESVILAVHDLRHAEWLEWFTSKTLVYMEELSRPDTWFEGYGLQLSQDSRDYRSLRRPLLLFDVIGEGQVALACTGAGDSTIVLRSLRFQDTDSRLLYDHCSGRACNLSEPVLLLSPPRCQMLHRTRQQVPRECFGSFFDGAKSVPLVTGSARSGTGFLTSMLLDFGFNAIHDDSKSCEGQPCNKAEVAVSWVHLFADNGDATVPGWSYSLERTGPVVHLVREPLAAIQSRAFGREMTVAIFDWLAHTIDLSGDGLPALQIDKERRVETALRAWVLCNSFAAQVTQRRFRLEDILSSFAVTTDLLAVLFGEARASSVTETIWKEVVDDGVVNGHVRALRDDLSWQDHFTLDPAFAVMALQLAEQLGYSYASPLRESVGERGLLIHFPGGVRVDGLDPESCWQAFDVTSACAVIPRTGLWTCSLHQVACPP